MTRLACMRCAKSHYKTFELKKEHYFVLQDCMHHQDDQVCACMCMYIKVCHIHHVRAVSSCTYMHTCIIHAYNMSFTHMYSMQMTDELNYVGIADLLPVNLQVRLSALGLLCESRRTTDPPNPTSLHMVLQFMQSNANTPSACFRYQMVNSIKKVFTCTHHLIVIITNLMFSFLLESRKAPILLSRTFIKVLYLIPVITWSLLRY